MSLSRTVLVGVTGGIGSGKSVVCRVCALRGIPVYDCDSRAKELMVSSCRVRNLLSDLIGEDVFLSDGSLDTVCLARHLFSDVEIRRAVEAVVHETVRMDIRHWLSTMRTPVAVIESAVLHTSSLDKMVDRIWLVDAPERLRVDRVAQRSGLTEAQIRARMECQQSEFEGLPSGRTSVIKNDGVIPIIPQIDRLLSGINVNKII